ncbi:MAG: hypothetical protein IIW11_06305 [Bacteroidales bacterium]|nr:hypothetical protein [Bacteroidales bacterium]
MENELEYYNKFEDSLQLELLKLCNSIGMLDQTLAESDDITEKWNDYATPYMSDAIGEINDYPEVTIAWPAYMGMAVAWWWDKDWLANMDQPYTAFYGKEGYDDMDDHIMANILGYEFNGEIDKKFRSTLFSCAEKTISIIMKEDVEPGSEKAFYILARAMKVMYKIGAALQLKHMGYKYTKMGN